MKVDQEIQEKKVEIANILFKLETINFGVFRLSSGKASPYYVDLRIIPSFPDVYRQICDFYSDYITRQITVKSFNRIAGVPLTGIIFASQVAYNLKKPFLYVRKGIRLQGRERRVEGILVSGEKVLLVDDLVTTGLTLKKAAEAVRAEGGVVTDAVVFLDREEGGWQQLNQIGIKLHSMLKVTEVANVLYEQGVMDQESLKIILKQVKKQ